MVKPTVLDLLMSLMEISSVSEEEHQIGIYLEGLLKSLGYNVQIIPIEKGSSRCNVYAYLGDSPKARICLTSHMDTVGPHIAPYMKDGIVYGRGACDDKGPLAAQVVAAEELRADGSVKPGDISLLFVVGEEKGGPGMIAANNMNLTWDSVIFGEPTEEKLALGHKGHYVFDLECDGIASHSGYPEKGRSANKEMITLLSELDNLKLPSSELLGDSTYHCATVNGGIAYNVISERCRATCAVRVASNLSQVVKIIITVVAKFPNVVISDRFAYEETLTDYDVPGFERVAVSYGTDIPRLSGSHKKYLFGPGSIDYAHGNKEQIKISELESSVNGYKKLVWHCLGL